MLLLLALLALALVGCAGPHRPVLVEPPDTGSAAPPTLIANVRVFDGLDDFLTGPMDVLVVGGRVVGIATAGHHEVPEEVEVVDGTGCTLLPGLVDLHVRFGPGVPWAPGIDRPELQAEALLWSGITSVATPGSDADLHRLRERIAAGQVAGPRIHLGTRAVVAEGSDRLPKGSLAQVVWPFRDPRAVRTADSALEASRAVRRDLEYRHADFALVDAGSFPPGRPSLGERALRAVVAEAAQYRKRTWALAAGPEDGARAAEAGVAILLQTPWESVLTEEQAQRIVFSDVPVVTTAGAWRRLLETLRGERPISAQEAELLRAGRGAEERPPPLSDADLRTAERAVASVRENLLRLRKIGAVLLVGTGSGLPGTLHGTSIHDELEALVALGIPPTEALRMATSQPVRFLDPTARFGVIAPGAYADLLLVRGDPTRDISAIRNVVAVWQAGRRLERRRAEAPRQGP